MLRSIPKENLDSRSRLIRCGVELFTERGFDGVSLRDILDRADLPKGSFYHHFQDKEAYVLEVIAAYDAYYLKKLDRHLLDETFTPLQRLENYTREAAEGIARYEYRRGCLVGNLGQEMGGHTPAIRKALIEVWGGWERKVARLLDLARTSGEIGPGPSATELASIFWIGWEGAVLRAKMLSSVKPLEDYTRFFLASLPSPLP